MDIIKEFLDLHYFGENGAGTIVFVFDVLLIATLLILLILQISKKLKIKRVLLVLFIILVLYVVSLLFKMEMFKSIVRYVSYWIMGIYIVIFAPDIKVFLEGKKNKERGDIIYNSQKEKEDTIEKICETVEYLSNNRIGALITFERKESLEPLISKAIKINADISKEILTTIFTPGTACHDGAVIISNNKIACAGAYYALCDGYDIPKALGTRHRAAIGVSERYDALTVVVSEETGAVSITIAGNINLDLTMDRLKSQLNNYLGND